MPQTMKKLKIDYDSTPCNKTSDKNEPVTTPDSTNCYLSPTAISTPKKRRGQKRFALFKTKRLMFDDSETDS